MKNNKSDTSRHASATNHSSQSGYVPGQIAKVDGSYYWLIERLEGDYECIGWLGDADAFIARFGRVPGKARWTTPADFGMKVEPPPGYLACLPSWLVYRLFEAETLPVFFRDDWDE